MNRLLRTIPAGAAALLIVAGCAQYPGADQRRQAELDATKTGYVVRADDGFLLGAQRNLLDATPKNLSAAVAAINRARTLPATVADVRRSATADLNHDGFVTVDEVAAMHAAGLSDMEIVRRLEATGHVFAIADLEHRQLLSHGVPSRVIERISRLSIA